MANEIELKPQVTVTISAPREISTHQLLSIAERMLTETPALDSVLIWKQTVLPTGKSLYVTIRRNPDRIGYQEKWTVA